MKLKHLTVSVFCSTILCACGSNGSSIEAEPAQNAAIAETESAAVSAVNYSGEPGNYIFSVTVESPDTGCNQYTDWWEVFTPDETLIYRRVLAHSHVNEQPFTRSGGPVSVAADEEIIIRAHMNNLGYGTQVFRGSVEEGFTNTSITPTLAAELDAIEPLPDGCAF